MELKYRRTAYRSEIATVNTIEVEPIGVYRGAPLRGKHYEMVVPNAEPSQLKYRGVSYIR
jgi:hypothetical protein